nr:TROVE domain-containing protein [Kibdelosporangium sp. MJ126-NF4]CEL21944.1 putative ribonucleoprotein-related protein [Kibdelosporangium sp. MJ126-NF4]CTQ92724.1 putative ribonucleoprotein-related protein [Kibdelosporangium sp. MJ126-NF4]
MSKFNTSATKPQTFSPVTTAKTPSMTTFEGGAGYQRDVKSELFLLAVGNMVGEQTFYESANDRDNRYADLVSRATIADPEWTARLLKWLRTEANMRSASVVGAAEFTKARLDAKLDGMSRQVVESVLQRADEPGEMLAYWTSRYGRSLPKPVKRGVADAVLRLYNERSLLKYDTSSKGFRFADVIDLVHPRTKQDWQGELFTHALDRRHDRDNPIPESLRVVGANATLRAELAQAAAPETFVDPDSLREAGMTWEDVLSLLGSKVDKARLWAAVIPSMGYMALLRNLRNFDQAGVSGSVAKKVAKRLADPEQVARSRQFPFRFLSAYETAPNLRWGKALDDALQLSLANLPSLPGRSLILIDTSASMTGLGLSQRSAVTPAKAAAVFGVALGAKGEDVDVVGFASGTFRHTFPLGGSVIREVDRFLKRIGEVGHGTDIAGALRSSYRGHDRVFIISDMQTISGDVSGAVPANIPIYGFNLGGYQPAAYATGSDNRHEFGGLTDATFRMVPLLEAGKNADWPF